MVRTTKNEIRGRQAVVAVLMTAVCLLVAYDPHPPATLLAVAGGSGSQSGHPDRFSGDLTLPTPTDRQQSPDIHPEGVLKRMGDCYPAIRPAITESVPEPAEAVEESREPVHACAILDFADPPRGPPSPAV